MKLSEIMQTLKATLLVGDDQLDKTIVAAGSADMMEDMMAALAEGSVLLTGVVTEHVLRTAKVIGVGAIVFVRGKVPDDRLIEVARAFDLPLMQTHYSMFVASGRLYMNGMRGLDGSW